MPSSRAVRWRHSRTFNVYDDLWEELDALFRAQVATEGMSKSEVIEEVLRQGMATFRAKHRLPTPPPAPPVATEAAAVEEPRAAAAPRRQSPAERRAAKEAAARARIMGLGGPPLRPPAIPSAAQSSTARDSEAEP